MNENQVDTPIGQDYTWELERFRQETRARPEELALLRQRLRRPRRSPQRWLWLGVPSIAAAAAALAVALWPGEKPASREENLLAQQWTQLQASPEVVLQFSGQGRLQTQGQDHDIDWQSGRLHVAVTPEQGISLSVTTPEAHVEVVGTQFLVERDPLGTHVSVDHGKVRTRCREGGEALLEQGQSLVCLPTTAIGLLNRAEKLQDSDPKAALAAVESGLARAAPGSVEVPALRYREALLQRTLQQPEKAIKAAEAAIAAGESPWLADAHRLAAEQGQIVGGCGASRPHLAWLAGSGAAEPEVLAILADCVAGEDPQAALRHLQAAEAAAADPQLKADLQRRIAQLNL